MIEYVNQILENDQFKNLCKKNLSGTSFLFESSDEVFLDNFVFSFAKFLLCEGNSKPCESCVNCQKVNLLSHPDLKIYPETRTNILVDDVKDLIELSILSPIEANKKVFIFKNFSSANIQSQNKLLKILEEPPRNVYILLCVSNISKVLPTILSRCQKIRLNLLNSDELKKFLNFENYSESDINKIICSANGNLSFALNYLNNPIFVKVFDYCLDILKNMKSSTELLKYSYLINKTREEFEVALSILENFYRDLLLIRLNKKNLVDNSFVLEELETISLEYDCDAIDKVIKKIYSIKKQLDFNCNYVLQCDSLLLYILEVKFLCKK